MNFLDLVKNSKKDASSFQEFRLAVLADSSTQFLVQALKGMAFTKQVNLAVFDEGLGQGFPQIKDPSSPFYHYKAKLTFIYHSYNEMQNRFWSTKIENRDQFAEDFLSELKQLVAEAKQNGTINFLISSIPLLIDSVYGQLGASIPISFSYQVRKYNSLLAEWASQETALRLLDMEAICSEIGSDHFFDPKLYYSSQAEISFNGLPKVAERILQQILSQEGRIKKCMVFDLDNTIWGGIVGDDGWENLEIGSLGRGKVFSNIQKWLKELKQRGILLCVCSKNELSIAKEVFEKHPEMVLKLDDITLFIANWEAKDSNLLSIAQQLNLGMDSIVFLDDNPAERSLVASSFPEVAVPDLPADPAGWFSFLTKLTPFDLASLSSTDADRTQLYQEEVLRKKEMGAQDLPTYLKSLDMKATLVKMDRFSLPRIAQLTQRTNQFNLRTLRYTEEQLLKIQEEGCLCLAYALKDKFGDMGIVSAVILELGEKTAFIDTWVMSCRVFGRGLEYLVFEQLTNFASQEGKILAGQYLPTPKNKPVEHLLPNLGFEYDHGTWYLDPDKAKKQPYFIELT